MQDLAILAPMPQVALIRVRREFTAKIEHIITQNRAVITPGERGQTCMTPILSSSVERTRSSMLPERGNVGSSTTGLDLGIQRLHIQACPMQKNAELGQDSGVPHKSEGMFKSPSSRTSLFSQNLVREFKRSWVSSNDDEGER